MGVDFIDYIIADEFIVPNGDDVHYSERVVRLPCFQVNDSKRRIAERTPTRLEAGLPEKGVVFCCFNNSVKINPTMFDVWMRLLRSIDGSVLWLLRANPSAEHNLRREAELRGIDNHRLVFADRVALDEHLARHRIADLFVDTLPYNAQTTASDALWAGLPVLTCVGRAFASRVAGSLLNASNLSELVTSSLAEYEVKATELARNPALLQEVREKLARGRVGAPLFQTDRFRRHIEAAFATMLEIHRRGEKPRAFAIPSLQC